MYLILRTLVLVMVLGESERWVGDGDPPLRGAVILHSNKSALRHENAMYQAMRYGSTK